MPMGLRQRLDRLERRLADPDDCDAGPTLILPYRQGEPEPPIPADAPRCRACGQVHVLLIEEVIVTSREAGEAVLARNQRADRGQT
jgi:hypothetical protein